MDDLHRVHGEPPVEQAESGEPGEVSLLPSRPVADKAADRTPITSSGGVATPDGISPYTIDEAIADAIEQIAGEPFPDPVTGDHNIEYWIWTGSRLVPASPETAERLRRQEALEEEEFRLLREHQRAHRQERWNTCLRLGRRLTIPLLRLIGRLEYLTFRRAR
jgi:hypothetical protein